MVAPLVDQHQQQRQRSFPWLKCVTILTLLWTWAILHVGLLSLQHYKEQVQRAIQRRQERRRTAPSSDGGNDERLQEKRGREPQSTAASASKQQQTERPSLPMDASELYTHHRRHRQEVLSTAADLYWNRFLDSGLLQYDHNARTSTQHGGGSNMMGTSNPGTTPKPATSSTSSNSSSSSSTLTTITAAALEALLHAAHAGHPSAQVHLANAVAAGFWTVATSQPEQFVPAGIQHWTVADSWSSSASSSSSLNNRNNPKSTMLARQEAYAMLLWHMAALAGHSEAAQILAHRIGEQQQQQRQTTKTAVETAATVCRNRLPYLAAAAHAVVDSHMASSISRGWVLPAKNKHILTRVHVASALDPDNRPDEGTSETLQYHYLQAKVLPEVDPFYPSNNSPFDEENDSEWDSVDPTSEEQNEDDSLLFPMSGRNVARSLWQWTNRRRRPKRDKSKPANAPVEAAPMAAVSNAYTLARYYHTGANGAPQNVTLAAHWYERAGHAGHWEAAGLAGTLYLYGIGVRQNVRRAAQLFRRGAPLSLEGCQNRYQAKLQAVLAAAQSQTPSKPDTIFLCDDASLNGMGVLYVLGLRPTASMGTGYTKQNHDDESIKIDVAVAMEYFTLARDQGNADAAYNLAMMKLGWKTHFTAWDVLSPSGQSSATSLAEEMFPLTSNLKKKSKASHSSSSSPRQAQPTVSEYKAILTDLTLAASKQHLLARHRLALLYESGIVTAAGTDAFRTTKTSGATYYQSVLSPDCAKAADQYQWILNHACPRRAQRMRRAYHQYILGDTADALRNYIAEAETGHDIAQMNAAFLLERGECLGLNQHDCAKASVRLYKSVADKGNAEASMRVGDFYYYSRSRAEGHTDLGVGGAVGPYRWMQYLIYPETYLLPVVWKELRRQIIMFSEWEPMSILELPLFAPSHRSVKSSGHDDLVSSLEECPVGDGDERPAACGRDSALNGINDSLNQPVEDENFRIAAHYYRMAAERATSPRANYNLGFMYEWGLGLKQDFPLAKRQYDLAISAYHSNEANVPVSLALMALSCHQYGVRVWLSLEKLFSRFNDNSNGSAHSSSAMVEL